MITPNRARANETARKVEVRPLPKAVRIRRELETFLAAGKMSKGAILKHMVAEGILGAEDDPGANLSTYLSRAKDLVTSDGEGNWFLVSKEAGKAA